MENNTKDMIRYVESLACIEGYLRGLVSGGKTSAELPPNAARAVLRDVIMHFESKLGLRVSTENFSNAAEDFLKGTSSFKADSTRKLVYAAVQRAYYLAMDGRKLSRNTEYEVEVIIKPKLS